MLLELKEFWLKPLFINQKDGKWNLIRDKYWKPIKKKVRWPYFIEELLKKFKNAEKEWIDDLEIKAIDFDYTSQENFKSENFKSADALIIENDKELIFIEFKQLLNNCDVKNFIKNLKFKFKVKDSFIILNNIIKSKDFIYKWKVEEFEKVEKKFIFSIKADNIDHNLNNILCMETFWLDNRFEDNLKVIWVEKNDLEKHL